MSGVVTADEHDAFQIRVMCTVTPRCDRLSLGETKR
jgi:hypothetical protein